MQDKIKQFEMLVEKKTKINKENATKASELLYEIYVNTDDNELVVNQLLNASHVVASKFFETNIKSLTKLQIKGIINQFIRVLEDKKRYTPNSVLPVIFSFLAYSSLYCEFKQSNMYLLKLTVLKCEDKSEHTFSKNKCKFLKEHLFDKCEGAILNLKYNDFKKHELLVLDNFIKCTFNDFNNEQNCKYKNEILKWRKEYNLLEFNNEDMEKDREISVEISETQKPKVIKEDKAIKKSFQLTSDLVDQMSVLYENIFVKNNVYANLENTISESKRKIQYLEAELKLKEVQIKRLNLDLSSSRLEVEKCEEKIVNLDTRLEKFFNNDLVQKNTELSTLKQNIATSLKLLYMDCEEKKLEEMNEDNYIFYKATLAQIFKTLKRYGIEF